MNREEFKVYAENSIVDISHKIDEIRQRANTIDDSLRMEYDEKIEGLLHSRDELSILIDKFDSSEETTWEEVKREFSEGIAALQLGFKKLFNLLST